LQSRKKYKLDERLFLLIPACKGPYAYTYELSALSAGAGRKIQKGMVKIKTEFDETWVKLVPAGADVPGIFFIDK
jgi:hypothetical protein